MDDQTITGTLYMMNDGVNLYIAVSINGDDDFTSEDGFEVYFDNDHGAETSMEEGDDIVSAQGASVFVDAYYHYYDETHGGSYWDTGTIDGQAAGSRQGTLNQFELNHPLDSADDAHDFSLSEGQTVGFSLWPGVDNSWWCALPGVCPPYYSPSTFANYVIASKSAPVTYGLEPILYGLIAALAILAIILFVMRRKRLARHIEKPMEPTNPRTAPTTTDMVSL
ncbi:MAG: hypothetical protein H3Z53_05735 [archaeon]|nr:hypothetical protein [archaeon]